MSLGRIYYIALATASWVSIFWKLANLPYFPLTLNYDSLLLSPSLSLFFLHISIYHLLSTSQLSLHPIHYPASWTGNWNRCLFYLVFKQLTLQAPSLHSSAPVAVCMMSSTLSLGNPHIDSLEVFAWDCVGPCGKCKEQIWWILALSGDPDSCPEGLLTAYRYGRAPAICGFGFEFLLCLLALCLEFWLCLLALYLKQVTLLLWAALSLSLPPYWKLGQ